MTGGKKKASDALDRLAAALVEDLAAASEKDILAEFVEDGGDPNMLAAEMTALFERTHLESNKSRLLAAKAGAARARAATLPSRTTDMTAARHRLHGVLQSLPETERLTLAARKESEMSDADVAGLLEDLRALGIAIPDDSTGGSDR